MRVLKHLSLFIVYAAIGVFVTALAFYVHSQEQRPDLQPEHLVKLDAEFTARQADDVADLEAYRRIEERVFQQLDEQVYTHVAADRKRNLKRYHSGSLSDPRTYPQDWNRTFELPVERPRGGILLLHGLSDSPSSLRALGQQLHAQGFWVVGLRLPGHGTAPAGLLHVKWEDYAAATRIAAKYVRSKISADTPFYMVGYSNGAALAVEYSLSLLEGESLPRPAGLVLISPAIGVPSVAKLGVWQSRLSRLTGLEKLAWQAILPEFDPFKYNSFPINAGNQIHRLTSTITIRMARLNTGAGVTGFPPVLAFQSVVDATIPPETLIDNLFNKLAPEGHELVLFDINRQADAEPFLVSDPEPLTRRLLGDNGLPFKLTLITNTNDKTLDVMALHKEALNGTLTKQPLSLAWPIGMVSLSHVALPFPPDDPVYGTEITPGTPGVHLGLIDVRGERDLLVLPADYMIRLRHNPFFSYLTERLQQFVLMPPASAKSGQS